MRLIDADNLMALLGDERATLHNEQQTFRAMSEIEFNTRDYMLTNFQYIIDNAPTVLCTECIKLLGSIDKNDHSALEEFWADIEKNKDRGNDS